MSSLEVGDKIQILEDLHNSARVFVGDVLEVTRVYPDFFMTNSPRLRYDVGWDFNFEDEGAGWEKYEVGE
ncbi:hypothetical protein ABZ353_10910 [Streptomyces niveus]|uniref:hypothetical protein n=1 Tax=Streptomyces niveus TaxID=193462 RepID=UPI003409B3A2